MIQCFGIKKCIYIYIHTHVIFKPHSIEIFHEILLVMILSHTHTHALYTEQPPSGVKTSKHRPIDVPFFFPRLALVRGQPQTVCGGIRRYCWCQIDALQGPGGHVSVNIHYQNP